MNDKRIEVHLDAENLRYIIRGGIDGILTNRRLLFSFKRLNYKSEDGLLHVPYEEGREIEVLQEINELFVKFGLKESLSVDTQKAMDSYHREQEHFEEFSQKAKKIRNNEFENNPEFVSDFDDFQSVVKNKLVRRLYPLQLLSSYHLAFAQNACNFAVPGAGKTSIVYGAYAYLKNLPINHPRHVDKLMVIGPLSSFAPWENEYQECFGKKAEAQRLSGDSSVSRSQKEQHLYFPSEITLIYHGGVDGLQNEIVDFLRKNKTMVVVDEAHRIKNPEGVWGKSVINIAKEAKSRVILTGTPVPNGYEDLFNLFQFIYPFKFKDILKFHYGNLVDMTKNSSPDNERVKRFTENISPYFIRIKKSDLKLPPVNEKTIYFEMGKQQREIYDFIETKYIKSFQKNGSATVKDILNKAKLIRLRQASTNPSLLVRPIEDTLEIDDYSGRTVSGKLMPEEFQDDSQILSKIKSYIKSEVPSKFIGILELLKEKIKRNEKVLIWTIFVQNAKEFKDFLSSKGIESRLLIGEVDQIEREAVIKKFNDQANNDFKVVIANPFAVAESISLHKGCHNAVYMERDYNCSNFLQSKDRIHRVGLSEGQVTNYYYILSKDSVDDVINQQLNIKVERMERIIDEEIPLFSRIDDSDETDLIKALLDDYAKRTQ
ncbi:MAG: DNA/RNA helicase, superfamily II, SNF2 family [Candidatus Falkowbacteria bacterium GW2011_GWC2_38_22]|uniref:DNA/RNA helicase, superfamily II, SNF2 family n=1 Tax=Candidatus Falkowbacteria bacterium GW2011_GWE1_38_31 TaxID=1618638 RepID=A0A0G0MA04_9BACT|nr:MAG: DNA/RNA helicase, superfamily II, SNF2 family [Candidatus Falkowbacteria bacterium GW2011_GWF2_38_1205]KKQ61714.1 MAG: DNA/RNA helicase, superfamily II, SNF2 family [Candidatus Falkowbacteria bacterium GW2011_GWC2_38_22]KKQ63671.1 MAG: DNA/RNA helicase, superfamily II, SNF2 family [Candidatus Falkowbacteria bacterium GW2011_GWF1_38_22]KKQ65913.1 MAG: DNA/RNA helicase, superfamily II, SNF2 family [Candidatus Falkowbacteria bacterium GW2011_GWE2_38_254]KKQ70534.1 MAG: DNA/RNA helicase, su